MYSNECLVKAFARLTGKTEADASIIKFHPVTVSDGLHGFEAQLSRKVFKNEVYFDLIIRLVNSREIIRLSSSSSPIPMDLLAHVPYGQELAVAVMLVVLFKIIKKNT